MRKGFLVSILVLLIVFSCVSCDFNNYYGAKAQGSLSIQESKDKNVFVQEYISGANPLIVNDSIRISIKAAWLEAAWHYSDDSVKTDEGYQLIVLTDKNDLKKMNRSKGWSIGISSDRYFTGGGGYLTSKMDHIPQQDTLEWQIQKGSNFSDSGHHEIIGKFVLIRK